MSPSISHRIETILRRCEDDNSVVFQLKQLLMEQELLSKKAKESRTIAELFVENNTVLQHPDDSPKFIRTGFSDLDKAIGGFMLGDYVVVGGRPGMGTTQFLVNLSLCMAQNTPVLYFSFDLSEFRLTNRFISTVSGIEMQKIVEGKLTEEEKVHIETQGKELAKLNLLINDDCKYSLSDFRALCQHHIELHGVQVIIVDELQLMSPAHRYRNSRELEINSISRELKSIAKDFSVCVIAASQLSRNVVGRTGYEGKIPQLSDLRESGAIEQDADKVIFIHRPEFYKITEDLQGNSTQNRVELIVAKNRIGSVGTVEIKRNPHFTSYFDKDDFYNTENLEFHFSEVRINEITANPF